MESTQFTNSSRYIFVKPLKIQKIELKEVLVKFANHTKKLNGVGVLELET